MWLLNQCPLFDLSHLRLVDETLWKSLTKLQNVCDAYDVVMKDSAQLDSGERDAKIAVACTLDGCAIEDLCLSFTLPGYDDVELCDNGADKDVTLANLHEYIDAVVQTTLITGVAKQMEAVIKGFEKVFPLSSLQLFSVLELDKVICGADALSWESEELLKVHLLKSHLD